jgi:predicted metal-dependent HD superfamily phosphohydrolase
MRDITATSTTPIVPVPCIPPGLKLPMGFLAEVREAHHIPARSYHTWAHVTRVLEHVGDVAEDVGWNDPRETWFAALFHDAVYVAGAKDNEAKSAALARELIGKWFPDEGIDLDRVAALIELTARHGSLTAADVDHDAALLLDCDMAVLGAPTDEFDRYEQGIADEYERVYTHTEYEAGRRAFLQRLLDRPRIFLSDHFHDLYDLVARQNLSRALSRL